MIQPPALNGAHDQDRTGDLILTKDALYQLSYAGRYIKSTRLLYGQSEKFKSK